MTDTPPHVPPPSVAPASHDARGLPQRGANGTTQSLLIAALRKDDDGEASLLQLLETTAREAQAFGCSLWMPVPWARLDGDTPSGKLFMRGCWLGDGGDALAAADLPIATSAAGRALLTGHVQTVDLAGQPTGFEASREPFLRAHGILAFRCVLLNDGERRAVLNLYYQCHADQLPDEVRATDRAAALLQVFNLRSDRASVRLVMDVEAMLRARDPTSTHARGGADPSPSDTKAKLGQVADLLAVSLDAHEVSIFLVDARDVAQRHGAGEFRLMATTFPEAIRRDNYEAEADSLTGWVLHRRQSLHLLDTGHLLTASDDIAIVYPGLPNWNERPQFAEALRARESRAAGLPVVGFIAVPVHVGGTVLGVIRACARRGSVRYFGQDHVVRLEAVAAPLATWWIDHLQVLSDDAEQIASARLLQGFVHFEHSDRNLPQPAYRERLSGIAAEVSLKVVAGADFAGVRLRIDGERHKLTRSAFAANRMLGTEPGENQVEATWSATDIAASVAARALAQGSTQRISRPGDMERPPTFNDAGYQITVPIFVDHEEMGVLDVGRATTVPFLDHGVRAAERLALQLGLYLRLDQLWRDRERAAIASVDAGRDLAHQLRTPLAYARRRVERLLDRRTIMAASSIDEELQRIRGGMRKAMAVTRSAEALAQLAHGEPVQLKLKRLSVGELRRMLIEGAQDTQLEQLNRLRVEVQVDLASPSAFWVDKDLLEQCIAVLLDNAGKYATDGTTVDVIVSAKARPHIAVLSEGIPFTTEDARRCRRKGWRSEDARQVSADGAGIGLWLVHRIMEAHGGKLTAIGGKVKAEFRLILPFQGGT